MPTVFPFSSPIHGDFIIGLPGETRETIDNTIAFAKQLDVQTIQVSVAHAYPDAAADRGGNHQAVFRWVLELLAEKGDILTAIVTQI